MSASSQASEPTRAVDVLTGPFTDSVSSALTRRNGSEDPSLMQIAWRRLRRDQLAMVSVVTLVLLFLAAVFAPLLVKWFRHSPTQFHQVLIDPVRRVPYV